MDITNAQAGKETVGNAREKIADAHAHIYPDKIAGRALRQIAAFYHFDDRMNQDERVGTRGYLLEASAGCGISVSLVSEAAHRPSLVPLLNDFIAESCALAGGRLLGLCTVHPGCEEIERILSDAQRRGLRGVKMHPDYQEFDMDDPACDPIYRFCQERHFPILIHCGDDRYDASSPRRLQNVIDRFPELPLTAAHLGGFRRWDESIRLRLGKYTMMDTSSSLFALSRAEAVRFFETFGYERFLFGSDYPLFDPAEELERFRALNLPAAALKQLLYDNFARFYGLEESAEAPGAARTV